MSAARSIAPAVDDTSGGAPRRGPRVLVIEDEWIVARDIQRILQNAGYEVPMLAATTAEALAYVEREAPDLVLVDISLATQDDGVALAAVLRANHPRVRVLFVSAHADGDTLSRVEATAPEGFVVKPFSDTQLRAAVRVALAPRAAGDGAAQRALQRVANVLAEAGVTVAPGTASRDPGAIREMHELALLTPREWEVLRALLSHQRVPQIARAFFISQHTVRNHLKSIFGKVGVHSQTELVELLLHGRNGDPR